MAIDRRTLLASGAALAVGSTVAHATRGAAQVVAGRKRNVVLLVSDDQGLDAGCYGVDIRTPVLDRLARQGTRFAHAYAAVSSCSPSRSVLYTGLYSHQNGMYGLAHSVHNQSLLEGIQTLPALLKAAGYTTALVGKKHVRPDSAFPYDAELAPERSGIRDVADMADVTERFIAGADKPFFVTVAYSDPHRAPVNFGNDHAWPRVEPVHYNPATLPVPSHLPDIPAVRADLAQYYESISRLDSGVGMVLQALQRQGHAEDTLVIFLSDNGRPFPGAKTNMYDPGLHLPLIIHAPGTSGGVVSDAMVSWVDITPTILDWAGVSGPASYTLPGRSLLPILGQRSVQGWDSIFASHEFHEINQYYPMRAIRTRTHSYIVNLAWQLPYPIAGDVADSESWKAIAANPAIKLGQRTQAAYLQRPFEELYDLRSDPNEINNRIDDPAYASVRDALRQQLVTVRTQTHDPWLAGQTSAHQPEGQVAG